MELAAWLPGGKGQGHSTAKCCRRPGVSGEGVQGQAAVNAR